MTAWKTWADKAVGIVDLLDPWSLLPLLPEWFRKLVAIRAIQFGAAIGLSAFLLAVVILPDLGRYGRDVVKWDLMLISGFTVVVIGLWLVHGQRARMEGMVNRLADRGVLTLAGTDRKGLFKRSEKMACRWSCLGGTLFSLLMLILIPITMHAKRDTLFVVLLTVGGVAAGYLVGRAIGRLFWYSFFWRFTAKGEIHVQPGHVDGVAGLKPVGDYYFTHAWLLAIPTAYLLSWSLLIPFWDHGMMYDQWRISYQFLLAIAIGLEVLAFILPMWRFHHKMKTEKARALEEADKKSPRINGLKRELANELDSDTRKRKQDDLDAMLRECREAEQMRTWPVSGWITRVVAFENAVFLVPLILQWADVGGEWKDFAERVVESSTG